MKIFRKSSEVINYRNDHPEKNCGLVPTMGFLHEGHRSLIQNSQKNTTQTWVSIFVNPTQFNKKEDLENYPRNEEQDIAFLEKENVDFLFIPENPEELYPLNYQFQIHETKNSQRLCGQDRPGHFEGVFAVLMKLFHLIDPSHAYFGEKDYQQYLLVKELTESFLMKTKVMPVPTQRLDSGLAMSSRNARLSPEGIQKAALIFQLISDLQKDCATIKKELHQENFQVDYVEEHWGRRFVAAQLEGVRLIDNIRL